MISQAAQGGHDTPQQLHCCQHQHHHISLTRQTWTHTTRCDCDNTLAIPSCHSQACSSTVSSTPPAPHPLPLSCQLLFVCYACLMLPSMPIDPAPYGSMCAAYSWTPSHPLCWLQQEQLVAVQPNATAQYTQTLVHLPISGISASSSIHGVCTC